MPASLSGPAPKNDWGAVLTSYDKVITSKAADLSVTCASDLSADFSAPVTHNLGQLLRLHTLRTSSFAWASPPPTSLTKLELLGNRGHVVKVRRPLCCIE